MWQKTIMQWGIFQEVLYNLHSCICPLAGIICNIFTAFSMIPLLWKRKTKARNSCRTSRCQGTGTFHDKYPNQQKKWNGPNDKKIALKLLFHFHWTFCASRNASSLVFAFNFQFCVCLYQKQKYRENVIKDCFCNLLNRLLTRRQQKSHEAVISD